MQIRLLCVPLCLGWILFGAQPSWAQDLSAPGKGHKTLQEQIAALEPMITRLATCAEQKDAFQSERRICQKALEQRRAQLTILREIAALKARTESADLPPSVNREIPALISDLEKKYLDLSSGSSAAISVAAPPATPAPATKAADEKPAAPAAGVSPGAGKPSNADQNTAAKPSPNKNKKSSSDPPAPGKPGGQFLRTIVGFEQAGASASNSTQKFFFDLFLSRPFDLHRKSGPIPTPPVVNGGFDLGPRVRSWGNLRISSVPQQISSSVAQFSSTFAQTVGELKVNEVAQSFEFLGGFDFRLFQTQGLFVSPGRETSQRVSLALILGGGVITPLTPKDSVQIFKVPQNQPDFSKRFPEATGKQFVAFTLPDRNRFFRQAYAGVRIITHHFDENGNVSKDRLPAMLDITYGFNESVTGGRIRGGVMRLEGFVPLPVSSNPFSCVYLFGTGLFKPGTKALIQAPFLLDPAPSGTLPTDPNAVVITTPQIDRDYYRVGIGIDLVSLVRKWNPPKSPAPPASRPTPPNP